MRLYEAIGVSTVLWYSVTVIFSLLQGIKRKLVGQEGRCWCYERQRPKFEGIEVSHTVGGTVIHT